MELRIRDGVIEVVFLGTVIAEHLVVSPGETSVNDDHYGGPRPMPKRPVRPKSREEKAFCELGPVAEAFIKGAAAQGMTGLARDMDLFAQMEQFHGRAVVIEGLERAVTFGRFRAKDVESIILSRSGVPRPRRAGQALIVELPVVPVRPLSDYAIGDQS